MFLKSLELNGFKSFAQKTVLEFPTGITAVVGPNGAGKSNIIDAIRWLLGEREAKNLRSAKAEDLIFNGTPKRPKMAMAQAGLYFDNNSGFFPIDFKEISIVRRVSRDGVSRYFLNKAEVRLKDIIDFFSRSRLGTKGLTIINQGDSDTFVKALPEERKEMIEEILGLKEYQIKKTEAERKLKNTFLNLEKVKAIIEEVVPRSRILRRQTNKWGKRLELQKELDDLEKNYFSHKLKEIKDGQKEVEPALASLEKQINAKQKEINLLESEIKKIESQPEIHQHLKETKIKQNQLLEERSQIQKELGRLEAKMEFLSNNNDKGGEVFKNSELIALIKEVKNILQENLDNFNPEKLKIVIEQLVVKIDGFLSPGSEKHQKSEEFNELKEVKDNLVSKFNRLEKELKELGTEETKITGKLEEFNKSFQKIFESLEPKRAELKTLEERKNKFLFEKERFNIKMQDLENQLLQIGKSIKEFDFSDSSSSLTDIDFSNIERRIFKLRTELSSIGDIDESLIKEAQEVENHYKFLISQSKDLEKAASDLKELIKELKEKIHSEFNSAIKLINEEFNKFFRMMFDGGQAKLKVKNYEPKIMNEIEIEGEDNSGEENSEDRELKLGIEVELSLPKKRTSTLEMLSGGEKSLVSIAALFALISISPPPFLVLDEIDAALDESNSKRFATLIKDFSKKTQFVIVTHNRTVMEVADVLYGITMGEEGTSKVLSLKLESEKKT